MKTNSKAVTTDNFINAIRLLVFGFILIMVAMMIIATIINPGIWNALN
ncbi:hypothetical protein [Maribacter sp. ACAM166]|nr:hypothetical protein [Maribacter sp. ACAM166]